MTDAPIPMPAETVLWVKALLSGNYKQTKGRLCKIDSVGKSYCCLGVAAEILGAFTGERSIKFLDEAPQELGHGKEAYIVDPAQDYNINAEVLSTNLWDKLRGDAQNLNDQSDLAGANDEGAPFAEIVDDYILPAFNLNRATFEETYGPVSQ